MKRDNSYTIFQCTLFCLKYEMNTFILNKQAQSTEQVAVVSKYLKQGSLMKRIWEFVKNGETIWSYGKTGRIEQKTRGLCIWDSWQVWKSIKICYWCFYVVSSFAEISSLTKSLIPPPSTSWSSLNTVFNLSTLYYSSGNWKSPSFFLDIKHYLYFN